MTSNLEKYREGEVSKDFRSLITSLQQDLELVADGVNIIVGDKENPIVDNSVSFPMQHYFMDGVYVREMTMFKGSAVMGAIHKHLHMCFLLKGHVTVVNENETVDYVAPCFIVSTPGVKRVLYAHEDSVWYNTHKNPTGTKNLKELEKDIIALNYEEYDEYIKNK